VIEPLDAARALAPRVHARAEEIEAARELPRDLFEALADAGIFHLMVPSSIGGRELDPPTYIQVIEELGKADASTAWVVNQGAVYATYAARMPRDAARAIWADVPRAVVANTPSPTATAIPVPGGYRVTGRQGFSTGCRHAVWLAAHATVMEGGEPRRLPDGTTDARYLFVPATEGELLDTWTVRGMRGTGTHHFAVTDVFVPEVRTVLSVNPPFYEKGPLYQIPRTLLFASGDAAAALGVARACLDAFVELAGAKAPRNMVLLRDQPGIQDMLGHAEADLRSARAFLVETVGEVWARASSTGALTLDERATLRLATTHGIRQAVKVVDAVYNASGVTAIYDGALLQRQFQDIHVISQHLQARFAHYELVGRHWLGLPIDEARL
jgi:alkylation response protein AidB-like acyl-CoA dehydrogenase